MTRLHHLKSTVLLALLAFLFPAINFAMDESELKKQQQVLIGLSLVELTDVEITSVSKKSEKLSATAAAVHVISQEDIRRSGVTSVAEALRMAPGINVARIDGNKWAIASRGLNGSYSAALLVMIDGREVYNPVFSGVLWDTADLMLEDIERIEVIRGPGATLWGSNAVNGVINIISKSTEDTLGGRLAAYAGNAESSAALRYGGKIDDHSRYRVYAKFLNRAATRAPDGARQHDDQDIISGGFRLDWQLGDADTLMLDGRYYESQSGQSYQNPTLTPPYSETVIGDDNETGGHILSKWTHRYSPTSEHSLKVYYNHQDRLFPYMSAKVNTLDIDWQHRFNFLERHDIVWGLGYRYQRFSSNPGSLITFTEQKLDLNTYNGFIQDEIDIIPEQLRFILGTKIEKAFFTDLQFQPSARIVWTPTNQHTLWGAVSRAVRTPSIIDKNIILRQPTLPPNSTTPPLPLPTAVAIIGNPDIKPESLIAYEMGYRFFFNHKVAIEISAFYNDYDSLTTLKTSDISPRLDANPAHFDLQLITTNDLKAESYGVEFDASWQVYDNWRLTGYYSYMRMFMHQNTGESGISGEAGEGKVPQQQASLRSSLDILNNVHWDLWFRYVDALPSRYVGDYTTFDTRLAWSPIKSLELSVVGQNLLDSGHTEYTAEFVHFSNSLIERSYYFKADWKF